MGIYPPGTYRLRGRTVDGRRIAGSARLSYAVLRPPVIIYPTPGQKGVATSGAVLRWQRVVGAKKIHLEIEQVETKRVLTVDLSGNATSLIAPDGFFQPGLTYVMDVKAAGPNRNLTVTDVTFKT